MSEFNTEADRRIAEWASGARTDSPETIGWIAETYRNYLLLIANQELGRDLQRKVAPSDIVQDTLMRAGRNIEQFRGRSEEELLGWLRQILRNQLIDTARQFQQTEKRQIGREQHLRQDDDSRGGNPDLAATELSPSKETVASEEREILLQGIDGLPDDYRQVIILRNWERLPFEEIAQRMGRTSAAVSKLWSRAVERLSKDIS